MKSKKYKICLPYDDTAFTALYGGLMTPVLPGYTTVASLVLTLSSRLGKAYEAKDWTSF